MRLHFAEMYGGAAGVGLRVFDVALEGQTMLASYDIFAKVGFRTAVVETFTVPVTDGALEIDFRHIVENPAIAAIEVIPSGAALSFAAFTSDQALFGGSAASAERDAADRDASRTSGCAVGRPAGVATPFPAPLLALIGASLLLTRRRSR